MPISRRNLFRQFAIGIVATKVEPLFASSGGTRRGPLRLDRNETAYGASEKAVAAMEAALRNRAETDLRRKIAITHSVGEDHVVTGNGSTSIMRMALEAFAGQGRKLIVAEPTFEGMTSLAKRRGVEVVSVPLTKRHEHDLVGMRSQVDSNTGLVYICNPNNLTGTLTPRRNIEAFIQALPPSVMVLIDEAYHHYVGASSDYSSFIDRRLNDSRVIVLRSFSKIYGLASARAGYAIALPETTRRLASFGFPDEASDIAAAGAAAALDDTEHVRTTALRNMNDRQEFLNQANARMVRCVDSQTNFVLINAGDFAKAIIKNFANNDIVLPDPFPGYEEYIRVSLGTENDMNEFWRVWDLTPGTHTMSTTGQ